MTISEPSDPPAAFCGEPGSAKGRAERIVDARRLLTINTGSSSLKAALHRLREDTTATLDLRAEASRIGGQGSGMRLADDRGETLDEHRDYLPDHAAALDALMGRLRDRGLERDDLAAVGHRIVYGGDRHRRPPPSTAKGHPRGGRRSPGTGADRSQPPSPGDRGDRGRGPGVPGGHAGALLRHRVPQSDASRRQALRASEPARGGGYHPLRLPRPLLQLRDGGAASPRARSGGGSVIVAHLGNGASMAQVRGGVGVDTTMGFTPTGGLVMGTRSGDLDPSVPPYLLEDRGLISTEVSDLLNKWAGLLGLSGTSAEMRDLLDREPEDVRAAEAVALFCYQAKKFLGALAAALGGLDALVFTGGIGEHSATVRERVCKGLEFLGIRLDTDRNGAHARVVSSDAPTVTIRVVPTDEDLMVARHTRRLIEQEY
jgi:acetate kinase